MAKEQRIREGCEDKFILRVHLNSPADGHTRPSMRTTQIGIIRRLWGGI